MRKEGVMRRADLRAIEHDPLPPTLQAAVAASLSRRERVLWLGRPVEPILLGLTHGLRGVVLLGLAVAAAVFARDTLDAMNVDRPGVDEALLLASGIGLTLPCLLLAAVALAALATPGRLRRTLRRTAYVVTDARAMVLVGREALPPSVVDYRRRSLRRAVLRPRTAGRGDVQLPAPTPPLSPVAGFYNVERVAAVHALLRDVAGVAKR